MICGMEVPTPDVEVLRRSEQRFRAAFQQQFQFMAILAPDGRVIEFNQQIAAEGQVVPREDVIGQLFWDTVWWRDLAEMRTAWPQRLREAALRTGPVLSEDSFTSSAGELRHAAAAITAVRTDTGDIDCFIVQATDTTEQRRAEAMKVALEVQLRETQKLEAIGTLAGGIAHDFNNILGAILGNVSLAREAVGPGHPAMQPLDQIRMASRRARKLVQQILAFSRRQPHEMVAQPLRPVVDETLALLRSTLPSAVRLDAVLPSEALWVRADATQMQQVLMNLCTNAWHALKDGRGRIEVGLQATSQQEVLLWVGDDGVGMDATVRQRMFEPFFTTKPLRQGTGLGLSVVHGIVTEHGGSIEVDSTPGSGSRFILRLPRVDAGGDSRFGTESRFGADSQHAAVDGDGRHVMYIDDDDIMVLVVESLLQRAGYQVSGFQDADLALAVLRQRPEDFDLVVTDYNMPQRSGIEVAREVARIRPGLPVVISSGYITDAMRAEAQAAGVQDLMNKENTLEELTRLAERILGGAQTA
jgi:PAS domain S-box-containing protein